MNSSVGRIKPAGAAEALTNGLPVVTETGVLQSLMRLGVEQYSCDRWNGNGAKWHGVAACDANLLITEL